MRTHCSAARDKAGYRERRSEMDCVQTYASRVEVWHMAQACSHRVELQQLPQQIE